MFAGCDLFAALDQFAFVPAGAAYVGEVRSAESGELAGGVGELDGVTAVAPHRFAARVVTSVTSQSLPTRGKPEYITNMSYRKLLLPVLAALLLTASAQKQNKKLPPEPPAHAKSPSPAVTDELIHK